MFCGCVPIWNFLSRILNMIQKYTGQCRCGAITYTIKGEPVCSMSCHCNWCQSTSGSAFRTFVFFKETDLEISGDSLSSYEDTTTEHGRPMINQFCENCVTQIGINLPNMDTRHVSIGTLDQRKDIKIKINIWWREALEFVSFPTGSDAYETGYWNDTGEKVTK
tara:strand:+ start:34 stop:525 length:492 start_codon:yes stop_codon:yes gene_type:complete